jgi:hypothetical protein
MNEIDSPSIECHLPTLELAGATYLALLTFGEVLLYACIAVPYPVDQKLALLSLDLPMEAALFGTVWPYYSVLHLLALTVGCALLLFDPRRSILSNPPFIAYAVLNLIGIIALPFLTPAGSTAYWDFAIEFLRLASLVILANAVLSARGLNPIVLARGLLILLALPLVFLITANPTGFLAEREGRVNSPGMEITSTGHVAALALLIGVSVPLPKKYRIPLIVLGLVVLLLSGARIPFVLVVIMVVVQIWQATKSKAKRMALLASIAGLTVLALAASTSNAIGGGHMGTLTGDSAVMQTEYTIGRGMAFIASIDLIAAHPLGYLDSDWSIQEELMRHGWPSHTHNNYFQSYLRFGPLMIAFWGVLATRARRGWRLGSPYASCLWFVLIGSAFDYYGCITKAMLFVFMIAELNETFIRNAIAPAKIARSV